MFGSQSGLDKSIGRPDSFMLTPDGEQLGVDFTDDED